MLRWKVYGRTGWYWYWYQFKAGSEMSPVGRTRTMPLPQGPDMLLYRRVSYGRLANFFVLDTRQYRTDQPCDDGKSVLCEEAFNPQNTMLGQHLREWLLDGLQGSSSEWNVLAQQVMMARHDRDPSASECFVEPRAKSQPLVLS